MGLVDNTNDLSGRIMRVLDQASPPGPQLAIELSRLVERMKQYDSRLEDLQSEYRVLVESHLKRTVPFHWNQNRFLTSNLPREKDENFLLDIHQYHQLVEYSLNAGGDYSILDYWGFEFPFENSQFGLARDAIEDYIDTFENIISNIYDDISLERHQQEVLEASYNYLINQFQRLKSSCIDKQIGKAS
jgi:hypothetical protein